MKSLSNKLRSEVLIANRHSCCICGEINVQIHHINGNNSDNRRENLAVLCLEHHNLATSPLGMTARLKPEDILQYKLQWEDGCKKRTEKLARSRTAFFMVDYKNAERIRQLYSYLSPDERLHAYTQLRYQFKEETKLRGEQGFNISLEPTTSWNTAVEKLLEEVKDGNPHPAIFQKIKGHPKDPLYPTVSFESMPPPFYLYDIWCQIMIRCILVAKDVYVLEDLFSHKYPEELRLEGSLISFHGYVNGNVALPDEWKEKPMSEITLSFIEGNKIWKSKLFLKTHYIYSTTASLALESGRENGILVIRGVERVENIGGRQIVVFKSTPLIIGSGVLQVP